MDFDESVYKPMLLDFQPKSKSFVAARSKLAQSNKSHEQQFLPLYPIFKDKTIHSVVVSDLKSLLYTSMDTQAKKTQTPSIQLNTRHKVFVSLLRVQLSSSVSDIIESLQLLK